MSLEMQKRIEYSLLQSKITSLQILIFFSLNATSSRSHAVFIIKLEKRLKLTVDQVESKSVLMILIKGFSAWTSKIFDKHINYHFNIISCWFGWIRKDKKIKSFRWKIRGSHLNKFFSNCTGYIILVTLINVQGNAFML